VTTRSYEGWPAPLRLSGADRKIEFDRHVFYRGAGLADPSAHRGASRDQIRFVSASSDIAVFVAVLAAVELCVLALGCGRGAPVVLECSVPNQHCRNCSSTTADFTPVQPGRPIE
jgi:hypothetical protein